MKLLTKTTLFFLTIALFVMFTGGIVFYFSFRYMVNREIKRELVTEMHQILLHPPQVNYASSDSILANLPVHYQIEPIKAITNTYFLFKDTLHLDIISGKYQHYRTLNYQTILNGNPFQITISKSLLISDELIEYVALVTLFLSLLLLVCFIAFNNFFFRHIWGNFFNTINLIKDYNLTNVQKIEFPESEIAEFNMLNQVFGKMHERIKLDFQNLKEFIENISHEIQTPLAIIKSKIDLLQQSNISEQQHRELIQSIQSSAMRLSNLNKSLILLSKIDNNQFPEREKVNVEEIVNLHLQNFEDIIQSKELTITTNFNNPLIIWADANITSIMLLNLLKNSIYHNIPSGSIEIVADYNLLTIKNTGKKLEINESDLFKRFTKSSVKPDSLGLGLAIVKKICDYYNFRVTYAYIDNLHSLTIEF